MQRFNKRDTKFNFLSDKCYAVFTSKFNNADPDMMSKSLKKQTLSAIKNVILQNLHKKDVKSFKRSINFKCKIFLTILLAMLYKYSHGTHKLPFQSAACILNPSLDLKNYY